MNKDKIHIPPFKIQGIKSKLVPLIKSAVDIDYETLWIEPFMGSGVVGLNIAKKKAIFADLNPHIINFYNQLKSKKINSKIVKDFLELNGAILYKKGIDHYYLIRDRFNSDFCPLDFLFLNRSCFNGMIRFNKAGKFNVPYGHKPKRFIKSYITKIVNQVKYLENKIHNNNWVFKCQSFEETISLANHNSFIYCDPPYIGRHVDYYDSWEEEQEMKLKNCLLTSNARFMLSTWDHNDYRVNPYLQSLWKDLYKTTKEHFYFLGGKEENRSSMIEALLTNYQINTQSYDTKPIQLTVY